MAHRFACILAAAVVCAAAAARSAGRSGRPAPDRGADRLAAPRVDGLWVNVFSGHARRRHVGGMFFHWLQVHRY